MIYDLLNLRGQLMEVSPKAICQLTLEQILQNDIQTRTVWSRT